MLEFAVLLVVCTCDVIGIPLENFYPFGTTAGDIEVPRNDDGSSPRITLEISFPFFDEEHESVYVSIGYYYGELP